MQNFRKSFSCVDKIIWYPSHQAKAMRQLQKGLHHIDLVVEVRDARIPFTTINTDFDEILGNRDRLVIYNKSDLANPQMKSIVTAKLKEHRQEDVIFTTAKNGQNVRKIIEYAVNKCENNPVSFPYLSVVVIGVPNCGKSTLINALRRTGVKKGKVTQVGKRAGVTTAIQTRVKIWEDPPIYLVDTPGIFNPMVSTPITGLKIALTGFFILQGATNDNLTTSINIADYLLFRLNNSSYIDKYPSILGLQDPTDDIYALCLSLAKLHRFEHDKNSRLVKLMDLECSASLSYQNYDLDRAAQYFIDQYREGLLGRMTLDDCSTQSVEVCLGID